MRVELKKLHDRLGTTAIYVTHDQVEAMTLGDRVVVMKDGLVQQVGEPLELYNTPANRFVAGFIGSPAMNFLPCRLVEAGSGLSVRLADALSLPVPAERTQAYRPYLDHALLLGIRPEHLTEMRVYGAGAEFAMPIEVVEPMGMETMVYFLVDGTEVCARVSPEAASAPGERMRFMADMRHMHLIDPATGRVIAAPAAAASNGSARRFPSPLAGEGGPQREALGG